MGAKLGSLRIGIGALLTSVSALAAPGAWAQTAEDSGLDEIIVTAQKREQSFEDVPFSVNVVGAEQLENATVTDVFSLRAQVPSLDIRAVNPPSAGASFSIRGLGTSVFNLGFESSVGTFIDGVYRARSGLAATSDFLDMERIEVLAGPQGTLFGRNTTAGVINMVTRAPQHENSLSAQADYNNWDQLTLQATGNFTASDAAAFRVSAYSSSGDGYIEDPGRNDSYANRGRWMVRGQALIEPTDALSIRLIADYGEADENTVMPIRIVNDPGATPGNVTLANAVGSCVPNPVDPDRIVACNNIAPSYSVEDWGFSGEINYDFGSVTLTSITSYREFSDFFNGDNDFIGVQVIDTNQTVDVSTFSQEFRLAGSTGEGAGSLDWILGAYYSDEEIGRTNEFIWSDQIASTFVGFVFGYAGRQRAFLDTFEQSGQSTALFAHGTYNATDRLSLTAGVRFTSDEKDGSGVFNQPATFPLPIVFPFDASISNDAVSGTLSASYALTDDANAYATYSRGYKSGGISLIRDAGGPQVAFSPFGPVFFTTPEDPTFDEETADHYEVGVKGTFAGGSLRGDLALFSTEFSDLQQQILTPSGTFDVSNVGSASAEGVDAQLTWLAAPGLEVSGGVTYLDASYGGDAGPALAGQDLAFSSRWQGNVGATYEWDLGSSGYSMFAHGDVFFRSSHSLNTDLSGEQGAYQILNVRAGLRSAGPWEMSVFCRNCLDERYYTSTFGIPIDGAGVFTRSTLAFVGEPRFYGLTVRYATN